VTTSSDRRGLDGLTAAELRDSRRGWWDDRFTDLLLREIDPAVRELVDVGCGLAAAAHALLPRLERMRYVGVDVDEARLEQARRSLEGVAYAGRVELRPGRAEALPCGDREADLVLCCMTLQHLPDVGAALGEARRVLAPGGTLLAVEPDNLGQRFYFDGPLEELNHALADLAGAAREARRPADSAVGPALPALLERAGYERVSCTPHFLGGLRRAAARQVLDAAARAAEITAAAARLGAADPRVVQAREAVARSRARLPPAATGHGGQIVPVFVVSARRGA
jgi:SAM-dependent methyltransferase